MNTCTGCVSVFLAFFVRFHVFYFYIFRYPILYGVPWLFYRPPNGVCYNRLFFSRFSHTHIYIYIYLTNRFHVAVHLSSNRSQRTSKCGKNKKVAHEAIAECVTDVLTTFWRFLWSITGQMHGNMESICFI